MRIFSLKLIEKGRGAVEEDFGPIWKTLLASQTIELIQEHATE